MQTTNETPCPECKKLAELVLYVQDHGWHLHRHPTKPDMPWQAGKKLKSGMRFLDVSAIDGYLLDRLIAIDAADKQNVFAGTFK